MSGNVIPFKKPRSSDRPIESSRPLSATIAEGWLDEQARLRKAFLATVAIAADSAEVIPAAPVAEATAPTDTAEDPKPISS